MVLKVVKRLKGADDWGNSPGQGRVIDTFSTDLAGSVVYMREVQVTISPWVNVYFSYKLTVRF